MKQPRINRRQFFKLSAFGAGTVAASSLVSVASAPSQAAQANTVEPHALALPQPTFTTFASTLPSGGPPADISAGWDGTLWAIDAQGAPHLYDPTQDAWTAHGDPLSGACWVGTTYYWFKKVEATIDRSGAGIDVATAPFGGAVGAPQPLSALFPNAPDSFALSLVGAANVNGALVLFNGGRYVPADGSAAAVALNTLANWPTTADWAAGVIDAVHSDGTTSVMMFNGPQFVVVNLQTKTVTSGPAALSSYAPWQNRLPAGWATTGIDAAFTTGGNVSVYKGTQLASFVLGGAGATTVQYIPTINNTSWPATWHPILNHAPQGRMNNLWVATTAGGVVQHDGSNWNVKDNAGNGATSVAVGQDSSVFMCGAGSQTLWQWGGTAWSNVVNAPVTLSQVAVGDAGHVFLRGTDNSVQRLGTGNTLNAVNLGAGVPPPTHLAANADGTVWHVTSSNPNAFRLISQATAPSAQIPVKGGGVVTSVSKVTSTGFGAAHCLTTHSDGSTQVYAYDSPYLFKTAQNYSLMGNGDDGFGGDGTGATLAQGLGNLYCTQFVELESGIDLTVRFVALDAHTGREVASYAPPAGRVQYTGLVFDPMNELVYVGTAPWFDPFNQTTQGQLIALDARTLAVKWTFTAKAGIDSVPALSGTQLCFGDRQGNLYMFDTRAARAARAAAPSPTPKWTWALPVQGAQTHRITTPALTNGLVYVAFWDVNLSCVDGCLAGTALSFAYCNTDGSNGSPGYLVDTNQDKTPLPGMTQTPVLGSAAFYDGPNESLVTKPALFVNGDSKIYAVDLTQTQPDDPFYRVFFLPSGTAITGFAYDDGTRIGKPLPAPTTPPTPLPERLWFGDSLGNLWSLDPLNAASNGTIPSVDGTPYRVSADSTLKLSVKTTPVLYKDTQGGLTVLFGVADSTAKLTPSLYGYDPDNGNSASVPTGVTSLTVLSSDVSNGTIWGGGVTFDFPSQQPAQVFGIRVDELPQALRDFIIEGEMLQDADQNATNGNLGYQNPDGTSNPIPPSVARYHTHITIVDDAKNPIVNEAVKIWADSPNTVITADGQQFTIGPDDASYAAVKTGSDGAFVLTMDAVDYFAPTLRVWAGFMDPYERIVVNPDTNFHQRVANAQYDPNSKSTTTDDPSRPNLNNSRNYKGDSLWNSDDLGSNPPAPKNVADSVQKAGSGLGLNTSSSRAMYRNMMRALGVKHKNQRVKVTVVEVTPPPEKYMAYADLPAATHFPTNIPANRLVTIAQPIGLSFSRPNGDVTQAPVFTPLSHIEARAQIDALQGEAWKPTDPTGNGAPDFRPLRTFNIFTDFWNWLKKVFDKIAQCILSIVEDILAAIQYVVDGILKVFKAILKVLADIFPFLGSFFKMLEKLIDDVIAALSILFEFGEIIWTHKWLAGQFQSRVDDVTAAITNTIQPAIDGFFENAEDKIKTVFDNLRAEFSGSGNPQLSNTKGVGQTPHTAFTVGPKGSGTSSSKATQCTWGTQKLKSGMPSASAGSSLSRSAVKPSEAGSASVDPVSDFFTTFADRLSNDPALSGAVAQLKSDFSNLFHVSSIKQFFSTLMVTLLDIVETLLIGALAVVNALVDGLLAVINDAIKAVMSILTTEIQIPVLTWLYETLFKEELTFLNIATLVAAIPVTIVFRIVEGQYPSKAGLPSAGAMQANRALAASPLVQEVLGIFVAIFQLVQGLANAVGDGAGDDAPAVAGYISLGCGLMIEAFTFPLIGNDSADVSSSDWGVYGVSIVIALSGLAGVSYTGSDGNPTSPLPTPVVSIMTLMLNLGAMAAAIVAYVEDGKSDGVTNAGFAEEIIGVIVGMINPVKLLGGEAAILVAAVDVLGGIIFLFISLVVAIEANAGAVLRPRRLHLPWVAYAPVPASAHP